MSYYVNPHSHSSPWFPYAAQFGAPNINWCEAHLGAWIDQPANAFSNAAYVLVAILLFWFSYRSRQKELIMYTSLLFGLGIASFIYHISNNYLTQVIDFIGMFAILFWMMALNLRRLKVLPHEHYSRFVIGGVIVFIAIVHLMYIWHLHFQVLIAFLTAVLLGLEFVNYKVRPEGTDHKFLITAAGLIFIASIFSFLDFQGIFCDPNNHVIQGHAIWHIVSALALGSAYFHYHQFNYLEGGLISSRTLALSPYDEEIESQLES